MPKIGDDLESIQTPTGYQFSAIRADEVESSEITLVTLVVDVSGSVASFKDELIACLKTIFETCNDDKNPRRENLMMRVVTFSEDVEEFHGYKMLSGINSSEYTNAVQIRGMTALYDGSHTTIESALTYAKNLVSQGITVNAINFVITDGADNASKFNPGTIKNLVEKARQDEYMESILNILIGVNTADAGISSYLKKYKEDAEFDQFVEIDHADKKTLLSLAAFVSQSISSQSQSLGSGGPSQLLTF